MRFDYEAWSIRRLSEPRWCEVEPSMRCIPLRNDPICRECYELSRQKEACDACQKQK